MPIFVVKNTSCFRTQFSSTTITNIDVDLLQAVVKPRNISRWKFLSRLKKNTLCNIVTHTDTVLANIPHFMHRQRKKGRTVGRQMLDVICLIPELSFE